MAGALMVAATGLAVAHSSGTCPPQYVTTIGDGHSTGTIYITWYEGPFPPPANETHILVESGVKAGPQGGSGALLGSTFGHDQRCYWPVAAERDDEVV